MFDLKLRDEFLTEEMRETAITLRRHDGTGALDINPDNFFAITYPSDDIRKALAAIDEKREGRPIVLLGTRGRGKSHLMAAMHHALSTPEATEKWARDWADQGAEGHLKEMHPARGYTLITTDMNEHTYRTLWDVLFDFDQRPVGQRFRGRFEGLNQYVPPKDLIVEMLKEQPIALLLDEFQTWFDGIPNDEDSGPRYRAWAFSFLQTLSEIATEYPKYLILIVSVRDNETDAYGQIHRNHPLLIDFQAPTARLDRQRLVLHRLFENRRHISDADKLAATVSYREERFRLIRSQQDPGGKPITGSLPF